MGLSKGEPLVLSRFWMRLSASPTARQGLSEKIPPNRKSIFSTIAPQGRFRRRFRTARWRSAPYPRHPANYH
jgi:hypothetical protein